MTEYKTYTDYPTDQLFKLAYAFRLVVRGINRSGCISPESFALPASSHAIVSASPDGRLAVNFRNLEDVLDAGWRRVASDLDVCVMSALEFEVSRAVDLCLSGPAGGEARDVLRRTAAAQRRIPKGL